MFVEMRPMTEYRTLHASHVFTKQLGKESHDFMIVSGTKLAATIDPAKSRTVEVYDVFVDKWHSLPPMNQGRNNHLLTSFKESGGNPRHLIYAIGGVERGITGIKVIERLNFDLAYLENKT